MKEVSKNPKISLREAEAHYESSKANYDVESGESHLAHYREKYPEHYAVLSANVQPKIQQHGKS